MTKREQIRNVCINTELYIQNDPNYRGCIESGHFTERFDPLIKQLTSTPSEPEDELREGLVKAFKAGREYQMGEYSECHGGHEHNKPNRKEWIDTYLYLKSLKP